MEFRDFTTGKDDDGRRLDRVLRIFLKDTGLSEIYKLLRKGLIKVNHKKAKPDSHLSQGDIISIAEFLLNQKETEPEKTSAPKSFTLKIVFENQHLLIIDKPYGRSVHGIEGQSIDQEVAAYYQQKKAGLPSDSMSFRPGPLHRLDRNTTGLLVFSMSLEGARWFSEAIKNHTVQKKYYGLAEGKLSDTENWEDTLYADQTSQSSRTPQSAQTIARPLAWGHLGSRDYTLVEYAIKTGRKHQIRIQSQLHGHPLAGDKTYGGKALPELKELKDKEIKREYYLQAYSLSFPENNPLDLPPEVKIALSSDFIAVLECCEIKNPGL